MEIISRFRSSAKYVQQPVFFIYKWGVVLPKVTAKKAMDKEVREYREGIFAI